MKHISQAHARVMRDALLQIATWLVNANSEPDVMGRALDDIRDLAVAALEAEAK